MISTPCAPNGSVNACPRAVGRYPVEDDPIRRHCHRTGDTNPLYLDPEFAASAGPYGEVIVPPSILPLYFASNGPWPRRPQTARNVRPADEPAPERRPAFTLGVPTPGDRGINMGTEWEFVRPIRVGEHLRAERTVTDVFVKAIKLDACAVWIVSETCIFAEPDDRVAVFRNTTLVHRSPKQLAADAARSGPAQ